MTIPMAILLILAIASLLAMIPCVIRDQRRGSGMQRQMVRVPAASPNSAFGPLPDPYAAHDPRGLRL
jgi:hypothetical protein